MHENETQTSDNFFELLKTSGLYVLPFSVGSSCLYLFGYWNLFKINIFQFAGLGDIVVSAIYPLIGIIGIFIFSGIFSMMHGPNPDRPISRKIERPIGRVFSRIFRHKGKIIIFYYLIVLVLLDVNNDMVRTILPLMVTAPVMVFIIQKNFIHLDPFPVLTIFLITAALNIPLMAYAYGVINGTRVRDGVSFTYVIVVGTEKNVITGRAPELLKRYIGHVGDFDFFYSPIYKTVTIEKVKDDNVLTLGYYKRMPLPAEEFQNPIAAAFRTLRKWYFEVIGRLSS